MADAHRITAAWRKAALDLRQHKPALYTACVAAIAAGDTDWKVLLDRLGLSDDAMRGVLILSRPPPVLRPPQRNALYAAAYPDRYET